MRNGFANWIKSYHSVVIDSMYEYLVEFRNTKSFHCQSGACIHLENCTAIVPIKCYFSISKQPNKATYNVIYDTALFVYMAARAKSSKYEGNN